MHLAHFTHKPVFCQKPCCPRRGVVQRRMSTVTRLQKPSHMGTAPCSAGNQGCLRSPRAAVLSTWKMRRAPDRHQLFLTRSIRATRDIVMREPKLCRPPTASDACCSKPVANIKALQTVLSHEATEGPC